MLSFTYYSLVLMQIAARLTSRHASVFPRCLGNTQRPVRAEHIRRGRWRRML